MDNDPSHVEISLNELKLLVNTLSKSVALSLKKRFAWLWLLAGLLIGVILTLVIVTMVWKNADNRSAASKSLLKRTDTVISDLQQMRSDIDKLTVSVSVLNQKTRTEAAPRLPAGIKQPEPKTPQDSAPTARYRVYLQYSDLKNKQVMKKFSDFLEEKGFEVGGIQRVHYQHRNIRFFHEQDKQGAQILRQYLIEFISFFKHIKKEPIEVIDLSRKYPKAQNGLLEVWVDF